MDRAGLGHKKASVGADLQGLRQGSDLMQLWERSQWPLDTCGFTSDVGLPVCTAGGWEGTWGGYCQLGVSWWELAGRMGTWINPCCLRPCDVLRASS